MISKLPRWIWLGALLLALVSGFVNAVGLLSAERQAITHLTGTTTMLAGALADGEFARVGHYAAILGAFLVGTMASGYLVKDQPLQLGVPYGLVLFMEGVLLAVSAWGFGRGYQDWGLCSAACACGLQNAMVSTYSGAVVRTTHVSGMWTDLGIFIGHALRGLPVDMRRVRICVVVISGFFGGGMLGCWAFRRLGYDALLIPSGVTVFVGCVYAGYRLRMFLARRG